MNYIDEVENIFDCSKYKKTNMKLIKRTFKIIEEL